MGVPNGKTRLHAYFIEPSTPFDIGGAAPESLNPSASYKLTLLVDHQELNNTKGGLTRQDLIARVNQCFGAGSCEQRPSKAGDYVWIARKPHSDEIVLDAIIERKTIPDLERCLTQCYKKHPKVIKMDSQMRKLQNCGVANKIILVEGTNSQLEEHKAAKSFMDELERGVHEGFQLYRTKSIKESLQFLMDTHRRLASTLPVAPIRTLSNFVQAVSNAMDCPKFLWYCKILRAERVGDAKATAILNMFPDEPSLRQAFQSQPDATVDRIARAPTAGGRTIGSKAANSLRALFGYDTQKKSGGRAVADGRFSDLDPGVARRPPHQATEAASLPEPRKRAPLPVASTRKVARSYKSDPNTWTCDACGCFTNAKSKGRCTICGTMRDGIRHAGLMDDIIEIE